MTDVVSLPALPQLSPEEMSRGSDPSLLDLELRDIIRRAIDGHPRSWQKRIGPSEIGTPCPRKLGYKLAGVPEVNRRTAWRPTVGTAVHSWLADAFMAYNDSQGFSRFLVELRVDVGDINGQPITGSVDLYDRVTCTAVDWKIVGPTTLKKARTSGPSDTYRTQVNLYGRGIIRRGLPVDSVAVMFLPVSGELSQAVYRPMPYDEMAAVQALSRAIGVDAAIRTAGPQAVLPGLPTQEDFCQGCSWFSPGSQTPAVSCAGRIEGVYARQTQLMKGLIA